MSLLRFLLVSTILAASTPTLQAQAITDPSTWTYEARKTTDGEYDVVFHLTLKDGWHIWSLQPGGDGFQIVPSFHYDLKKGMKTDGRMTESGQLIHSVVEGVEGQVNYYSHEVIYTQHLKAPAGTLLSGKHEYQVCTDALCLPPVEKAFSIELK